LHIAFALDNVAQMDANADVELLGTLFVGVIRAQLGLHDLCPLHRMHDGRKLHEEAIAGGLNDVAMMGSHRLPDDLGMEVEQAQHAGFIGAHLTAEADRCQ
jgi:hypothetical protein